MSISHHTDDTTELFFQSEAVVRYKGRNLKEGNSIRILWAHGIRFSKSKGKARRESPLIYLMQKKPVPVHLQFVVVSNQTSPGNKLWGRIDFLINHCGYQLLDERD